MPGKVWPFMVVFLCLVIVTGCESFVSPTVCTTEFVALRVTVLDAAGLPADSVNITVMSLKSGEIYDLTGGNKPGNQNGQYFIFHDGYLNRLKTNIEFLNVKGEKQGLQFSEVFLIGHDECHVFKIAGPDTVILAN